MSGCSPFSFAAADGRGRIGRGRRRLSANARRAGCARMNGAGRHVRAVHPAPELRHPNPSGRLVRGVRSVAAFRFSVGYFGICSRAPSKDAQQMQRPQRDPAERSGYREPQAGASLPAGRGGVDDAPRRPDDPRDDGADLRTRAPLRGAVVAVARQREPERIWRFGRIRLFAGSSRAVLCPGRTVADRCLRGRRGSRLRVPSGCSRICLGGRLRRVAFDPDDAVENMPSPVAEQHDVARTERFESRAVLSPASGRPAAADPGAACAAAAPYAAMGVSTTVSRSLRSSGSMLLPRMRMRTSRPSARIASTSLKNRLFGIRIIAVRR